MVIYLVTNKINGKKYVGQTSRPIRVRWSQHVLASKKGSELLLHAALRKYGEQAFIVELLSTHRSGVELDAAEIAAIEAHGCRSPNGYNLTAGGKNTNFSNWQQAEAKWERKQFKEERDDNDAGPAYTPLDPALLRTPLPESELPW